MPEYVYIPRNVCSRELHVSYEGNTITGFYAVGGCNGNLQGIGRLVEGMDIDEAIRRLEGIKCRGSRTKETSCPDQLASALKEIKSKQSLNQ